MASEVKLNIKLVEQGDIVVAQSTTDLEKDTIKPAQRVLESFMSLGLKPRFDALETYEERAGLAIKVIGKLANAYKQASTINMEKRDNGELYDNPKADEKFYEVEKYLVEKLAAYNTGLTKGMKMLVNMVLGGERKRTNKDGVESVVFTGMGYDIPVAAAAAVSLKDRNVSGRSLIAKALSSATLLDSEKHAAIAALFMYSAHPTHVIRLASWDNENKKTVWFDEVDLVETTVVVGDDDVALVAEATDFVAGILDSIDLSDL